MKYTPTQKLINYLFLTKLLIIDGKGRRSAERWGGKSPHLINNFGGFL
jgi:hypothetical protein